MGSWLKTLLGPASKLYLREITRRNSIFDAGKGVVTLDRPVISIGNLSVGGTGKSPMVAHVIEVLRADGRQPCVAMRGYGSKHNTHGTSDEADEYSARFQGLQIVARPNRTEGLIDLFGTEQGEEVDSIVLDDGFQHRRIARSLDIVLIDLTRSPFEDELLPVGRLREPVDSLSRARVVVLTHAEAVTPAQLSEIRKSVLDVNGKLVVGVAEHAWVGLDISGSNEEVPVQWLDSKRVLPLCAIGNPDPFLKAVEKAASECAKPMVLRDHDPYKPGTIAKLIASAEGCDAIVCTAKDWSKLRHVPEAEWPCPVARPKLAMQFRENGDRLDELVRQAAAERTE
jgi:tetraacyldisaccharide 4'-kinase